MTRRLDRAGLGNLRARRPDLSFPSLRQERWKGILRMVFPSKAKPQQLFLRGVSSGDPRQMGRMVPPTRNLVLTPSLRVSRTLRCPFVQWGTDRPQASRTISTIHSSDVYWTNGSCRSWEPSESEDRSWRRGRKLHTVGSTGMW